MGLIGLSPAFNEYFKINLTDWVTYLSDIGDIVLDAQRIMKNNLDLDTDQIEKEILYQNIKLQISPLLMFYTTVEQFTKKVPK